jgi:hypothetical protein
VFNTYYLSGMHSLKVTPIFIIADYGGISISTARGRLTPEGTSPVDRATAVFYSCFIDIYRLSCTVSTLFALFVIAENDRKTISVARGRARPEVKSPFDYFIRFGMVGFGIFRLSFTYPKLFDFFDLHVKCPLKIFGKGYSPVKNFFHR